MAADFDVICPSGDNTEYDDCVADLDEGLPYTCERIETIIYERVVCSVLPSCNNTCDNMGSGLTDFPKLLGCDDLGTPCDIFIRNSPAGETQNGSLIAIPLLLLALAGAAAGVLLYRRSQETEDEVEGEFDDDEDKNVPAPVKMDASEEIDESTVGDTSTVPVDPSLADTQLDDEEDATVF